MYALQILQFDTAKWTKTIVSDGSVGLSGLILLVEVFENTLKSEYN